MNRATQTAAVGRTRVKRTKIEAPKSLFEANRFIEVIGKEQRAIEAAVLAAEAKIALVKAELETRIAPHLANRKSHFDGIFAYATVNKAELTKDGKTIQLTAGRFLWRYTPPAVAVESDEEMIEKLKSLGKGKYVRKIEELDREALLADRAKLSINGLSFTQREEFVVVPDGIESKELKKARTIQASEAI